MPHVSQFEPRRSTPWLACVALVATAGLASCGSSASTAASSADSQSAVDSLGANGADSTQTDTKTTDTQVADSQASGDSVAKADVTKAPCKPWETPTDWNCPAGTHCGYDENDAIACVPSGSHGVGEDCADGGGCKIGLCVQASNGTSACAPFCTVESQCDSNSCNKIKDKKYSTCDVAKYTACAPLTPKCPTGQGCYDYGALGFVCANAGSLQPGEACINSSECAPGLTCAGAAGSTSGLCRKLCSTTAKPNGCDDPSTNCSQLGAGAGYCEQ